MTDSGERQVNYARPATGTSPIILAARSGLVEHRDLTGAEVRAVETMGGSLYAVTDGSVYKITDVGAVNVGGVPDGVTDTAASDTQLAIVAGGRYFVCDGTSTTEYTAGALTTVVGVEVMDGFFIPIGSSGGRLDAIQISDLDDATTFNALDFAFAEESPDALVGVIRDHGELYLFGEKTVQVFYNSGASDFPFIPNKGALIEQGCIIHS